MSREDPYLPIDAKINSIGVRFGKSKEALDVLQNTGCPKINFTFLNVNNVRTNIRIATPAIYIDRGHL